MSWMASGIIKKLRKDKMGAPLSCAEKCILLVIADYYDDKRREAWPSVTTIANESCLSERHVRGLLREMDKAERGLLEIIQRKDEDGINSTNLYKFRQYAITYTPDDISGVGQSTTGVGQSEQGGGELGSRGVGQSDVSHKGRASNIASIRKPSCDTSSKVTDGRSSKGKLFPDDEPVENNNLHVRIRERIFTVFEKTNHFKCAWEAPEGKLLNSALKRRPHETETFWFRCIDNRFKSEVNHADDPRCWLSRLTAYANSPLDRFGHPMAVHVEPIRESGGSELEKQGIRRDIALHRQVSQ